MNNYEFTFYNIRTKDIQKTVISAADAFCAYGEALTFWREYFSTPLEWTLNNMEKI